MKKVISLFATMLLIVACDPLRFYHIGELYVKNYTDQTLTITFPIYKNSWFDMKIVPGDSICIGHLRFAYKGKIMPNFDTLFQEIMISSSEDKLLNVLSEQGELLKKWSYTDKDLPDKQFFKESSWRYYERPGGYDPAGITAIWVFDIKPEDLIEKDD